MSILIEGMEMPKNCGGCFLRFGQCSRRIYMENRPTDCPLIEVPEPHGRLIDADEMFDEFVTEGQRSKRYKLGEKWELNGEEIRSVISRLPTVIPANEEG